MNHFKSFIPYYVPPEFITAMRGKYLAVTPVEDPEGSSWRTVGLTTTPAGDYIHPLDGIGVLFWLQFNERILPGSVRDEHLAKRIAELTERQGYKPGRKEYAQIKDEVTFELLPKAFIKRSVVPVLLLRPYWLLVCTSSSKRADDALAFLNGLFHGTDHWHPKLATPMKSPIECLSEIARTTPGDFDMFEASSAAVLKGENKRTIRIKDRDIYGDEVQEILSTADYGVHELGLNYYSDPGEECSASLILTEKMVFKGIRLTDQVLTKAQDEEGKQQDFRGLAWLIGEEYRQLANNVFVAMGGLRLPEKPTPASAADDDEL